MSKGYAIGYFICSNIQHLPPVIQLYPRLGGELITTKKEVSDLVKGKYSEMGIPVHLCKNIQQARKKARKLKLRMVIHTSFHLLYCGKAVQIFHGGLSDKRYLESARLISYDLVLFPGQKSVDKVKLATTLSWLKEWYVVGYPKFDPYLNGQLSPLRLFSNNRKTILYAPTWVSQVTSMQIGQRSRFGESSLQIWSLAILQQLSGKYNLILKFHSNMNESKLDIYQQIQETIEQHDLSGVVKTVIDDNILPYMHTADLMISDISSVCYEWLHFDRPILFANPAPGKYTVGDKITDNTFVWQCGEVINQPDDILRLVDQEIANDHKAEIRNRIFRYAVFQPDGQAGERQAEHIINLYKRIKSEYWWWLYLKSAVVLRLKRLTASILRYTKGIPR